MTETKSNVRDFILRVFGSALSKEVHNLKGTMEWTNGELMLDYSYNDNQYVPVNVHGSIPCSSETVRRELQELNGEQFDGEWTLVVESPITKPGASGVGLLFPFQLETTAGNHRCPHCRERLPFFVRQRDHDVALKEIAGLRAQIRKLQQQLRSTAKN